MIERLVKWLWELSRYIEIERGVELSTLDDFISLIGRGGGDHNIISHHIEIVKLLFSIKIDSYSVLNVERMEKSGVVAAIPLKSSENRDRIEVLPQKKKIER